MRVAVAVALLAGLSGLPLAAADTYCSATVPCTIGCCGKNNICGLGPDYCSPDKCIDSCNAKADCNPAGWPAQYVSAETCPLNVCCSQYGFCGTTEEFCGNSTVKRPSCDVGSQSLPRVIGYYASGGAFRACDGMVPVSFPQGVYSHIYFAFGSIDPDTFEVIPTSIEDEQLYPQLKALYTRDLGQQLWLSIGGWDFTDSGTLTATTFSDLAAADITYQNVFFSSLTLFMATWGFTGVDIDWEYPAADDRNGRGEDYNNYPKFLANLKSALDEYKFGLSITLPTSYWYLQHFDLVAIEPLVNWFNYMSYDLHGTWDIGSQWTGAYVNAHTNLTEIKDGLDLLWRNNISPSKVNLGLAFYGRSFTLASSSCSQPGCTYLSAGDMGDCSAQAGILLGSEIEQIISENNLTTTLYTDAAVKTIAWNSDQWVSFDDQDTFKIKADFAKSQCLGGVFVWSVDYDDTLNTFSDGLADALGNPLNIDTSTGLTITIADSGNQESQNQYCQWTNCGDGCPNGFTTIVRDDEKGQIMLDSTECLPGTNQFQVLCCPTSTTVPTCRWAGFHNNGKCEAGCNSNEAEVGTVAAGCRSGYQSACCTITPSTAPWASCQWTSSCESDSTCPSGYSNLVVGSRDGWGGRPSCSDGEVYNYCCSGSVPDAFTNCDWFADVVQLPENSRLCSDACPSGSIRIAEETVRSIFGGDQPPHASDCLWGMEAYCCSGPSQTSSSVPRGTDPFIYQDQTARDFDALLQKFLASPVCPGGWDAQYSAADDNILARGLVEGRATDETLTLTSLLPILAILITSQYPRLDLQRIMNYRLIEYGFSGAANSSIAIDTLFPGSRTGAPLYDANVICADWLCNIADSAYGLESLDGASTALCQYVPVSSTAKRHLPEISARRLSAVSMDDRSSNNIEPTIAAAMNGILNGDLTLHYLRWINADGDQVLLELAFWIGTNVGIAPTAELLDRYRDYTHTTGRDRWVVMHFHINLDMRTFLPNADNWYLGVTTVTVYHSQDITQPRAVTQGARADYRAEFRYSGSYGGGYNAPGSSMYNYNDRTRALACPIGGGNRWYPGQDRTEAITELPGNTRPPGYSQLLNRFGLWLYGQGIFSSQNLVYIWPSLADYQVGNPGDFPTPSTFNAQRAFRPVNGAFDINWLPDGTTPQNLVDSDP